MSCRIVFARACRAAALGLALAIVAPLAASATWWPYGNPVAAITGEQWAPQIATDGRGGAFAVWREGGNARVQHLLANGEYAPGWPAAGVVSSPPWGPFTHAWNFPFSHVADDSGGLFVATVLGPECYVHCGPADQGVIAMQRLAADGTTANGWPAGAVLVFTDQRDAFAHDRSIVRRASGAGVLVLVEEFISNADRAGVGDKRLRLQFVASNASEPWGGSGVTLARGLGLQSAFSLVPDERGGALVVWGEYDSTRASVCIRGQHVAVDGRLLWGANGRMLSGRTAASLDGLVAVREAAGWIVARISGSGPTADVVAMRVGAHGEPAWRHELLVRQSHGHATDLEIVSEHGGGAITTWRDYGAAGDSGLYAQRISPAGCTHWGPNGTAVCTAAGGHGPPQLASDGKEGAYVAWADTRPAGKLFATHLDPFGHPTAGWARDGSIISTWTDSLGYVTGSIDGPYLATTERGDAMVSWESWQFVLSRLPFQINLEQGYVMLLTPHGPAASPVSSTAPSRIADTATPALADAARPGFALRSVAPNPAALAGAVVRFALPDATPAALELFDVAGRRVWSRDVSAFGAGEHALTLRDGQPSPPGLYLVRLRQGERVASTRVVLTR